MKKSTLFLLGLSLFIMACQDQKKTEQLEQSTVQKVQQKIHVKWNLKTNLYEGNKKYLSQITLSNQGEISLKNNWELFFSNSPCRKLFTDLLPKGIELSHINGDLYKLTSNADFQEIKKGDSLVISLLASDWVIKEGDAPSGFYFIFDKNDDEIIKPVVSIVPFTRNEQVIRNADDVLSVPTSESIYHQNERLSLLERSKINKITPTPVSFISMKMADYVIDDKSVILVSQESLKNEAEFLQKAIKEHGGLDVKIVASIDKGQKPIILELEEVKKEGENPEEYEIITNQDKIVIKGASPSGIFYGVQSLKSLFDKESKNMISSVKIKDYPRFSYRGLHVDVSRNFQSKESILKILDVMSLYKLNKFHFHLTDDEGWRLAINDLPELTEIGAKRIHTRDEKDGLIHQYGSSNSNAGSGFYTQADFVEILRFAKARHIEIIPEIDMPGHARAAIVAMKARYENYLEKGDSVKALEYVLHDVNDQSTYRTVQNFNDNVVCVAQPSTYHFLDKVLNEVIALYKEADAPLTTIHTGGDEVPVGAWEKSPICQKLIDDKTNQVNNVHDLKAYFLIKFNEIIASHQLKTAGWEEIALHLEHVKGEDKEIKTVNPDYVSKNFQPYVWNSLYGGSEELGYQMANAGYKIVLSNVTHFYFDMAYDKNPKEKGLYWGGFLTEEQPYLFEPFNLYNSLKTDNNGKEIPAEGLVGKTKLTKKGKANILGLQGQVWSETIKTPEDLDNLTFPKLISLGERAWSPEPTWIKNPTLYSVAWNEFANRLGQQELAKLDDLNVSYHIPMTGAIIKEGKLYANTALPGLDIRYTTDGTEPTKESTLYKEPIDVSGKIILGTFNQKGRRGLLTEAQ